jgi:acetyl-CoA carboxylase carboxyltransferase component
MHTATSAVAHYLAKHDADALDRLRDLVARLPRAAAPASAPGAALPPKRTPDELYDLLPADHRMSYDMRHLLDGVLDEGRLEEFQADHAREMLCGHGAIAGRTVAVIANHRGLVKDAAGGPPRFGGIIYTESAEKVAYFIEMANRERIPILFVQDVSGFMVGPEAEASGIIRAGARFVEAMATASVPKLVLTVNHASGAGYYAMAGQGFDPDFIFSLPTGRMGVMEGESAVGAVYGPELEKAAAAGGPTPQLAAAVDAMRADYEHQLDATHAAARGFVDAIVTPEELRDQLAFALRVVANYPGPHLGPYVLPCDLT